MAGESLCLQFSGVALRVFVSLCLIVLWLFVAPPKHPLLPSLGSGQISTRTYGDKYTYLVG